MTRYAVIMAGGSGERFWPLSRVKRPKQLLRLASDDATLLEQTISRLKPLIQDEHTIIATAPHLVGPSQDALPNFPAENVRSEPHKRNTAGCLVWVAAQILASNPNARAEVSMAVLAADHRIAPDDGFRATISAALDVAENEGGIVTIGVRPTRPETGYGYIEVNASAPAIGTAQVPIHPVGEFREKPDRETAESFLKSGHFLWNSGTFFWTLDTFLNELERAAPELYASVHEIAHYLKSGDQTAAEAAFERLPSISIDYALMEKATKVFVAEAAFEWDDVGSWDALDRSLACDAEANVQRGDTIAVQTQNSIIVNESTQLTTCVLGMDDVIVVVTDDAVMVCPKGRAQDVRKIVDELKSRGSQKF